MRYSPSSALNEVYDVIGQLYVTEFRDPKSSPRAMTIAAALRELGEHRSWASVWWAYGAIHFDLSDDAYATALRLLDKVDASAEAQAAALMLRAQIRFTQAVDHNIEPNDREQVELLGKAVERAPEWPLLRVRLARALQSVGEVSAARREALEALQLAAHARPSEDPFDVAFTGSGLRPGWARDELAELGLVAE